MLNLTNNQKGDIYKRLIDKSPYEVGIELGYDKEYPNKNSLRTFMYNVKTSVERDPAAFGIDLALVEDVKKKSVERALVNRQEGIDKKKEEGTLLDLMGNITRRAGYHIEKILARQTLPKNVTISQLVMAMGVAVDKTLLLSGRATENIAFRAKIDVNLSSDKLLEALIGIKDKK